MALENNRSPCKPPAGSTPILTVNIPGGLAINLLGIHVEACPTCVTIFTDGSGTFRPQFLSVGDNTVIDASGNESHGSFIVTTNVIKPLIITYEENITVNIDPIESESDLTNQVPNVSDNCSGSNVTVSGTFPVNRKTVTSVATNTSKNITTCATKVKLISDRSDSRKPNPTIRPKPPKPPKPLRKR